MRATLTIFAFFLAVPADAGADVAIESKPCCEEQRAAAARSPEEKVIVAIPEQAFRDRSVLWLKLDGNRSVKIVDCIAWICSTENFRRHELVAWWPMHRVYVVDVGLSEGRGTILISEQTGQLTTVFAPPILSPSGRHAVAADLSPAYGSGLQIIDMSKHPPTTIEVKTMPACPGTGQQYALRPNPVWLDDSRIGFEGEPFLTNDDPTAKQVLWIVDGKPEWEY